MQIKMESKRGLIHALFVATAWIFILEERDRDRKTQ